MTTTPPTLRTQRIGPLGVLTLDRATALNALDRPMVAAMLAQASAWHADPEVAAVVVRSAAPKAFCAGGDVRAVVQTAQRDGIPAATAFFRDEYRLNRLIAAFAPKPWIAVLNGLVMGGGVGLSVHGSHRIVIDGTVVAMPETAIGLFPDVGTAGVLARLPDRLGWWLATTGARLDADQAVAAGIATHRVRGTEVDAIVETLAAALARGGPAAMEAALDGMTSPVDAGILAERRAWTARIFAEPRLVAVHDALSGDPSPMAEAARHALAAASPLSAALTAAHLARSKELDVAGVLALDWHLAHACLAHGEFAEGVRAALIDKDRTPRWRYADAASVPDEAVRALLALRVSPRLDA